jgi:hypothetical protein
MVIWTASLASQDPVAAIVVSLNSTMRRRERERFTFAVSRHGEVLSAGMFQRLVERKCQEESLKLLLHRRSRRVARNVITLLGLASFELQKAPILRRILLLCTSRFISHT